MAVQESPTSIQVSWTPSPSVRATTGYRIEYTSDGGSSGMATVSGDTTTHLLEGLQSGETYTISILTISDESTSDPSVVVIHLNVTGHTNAILRRASTNNYIMYVPLCQVAEEGMEGKMEGEMEGGVVEEIEVVEEGELMEVQWLLVFLYLSSF